MDKTQASEKKAILSETIKLLTALAKEAKANDGVVTIEYLQTLLTKAEIELVVHAAQFEAFVITKNDQPLATDSVGELVNTDSSQIAQSPLVSGMIWVNRGRGQANKYSGWMRNGRPCNARGEYL